MNDFITFKKKTEDALIPEYERAASVIPVLAYCEEDHVFLMDDQSLGFGFICEPLVGADEKIQERVNSFLNQPYPAHTLLQFALFRSPDIYQQMAQMFGLRDHFRHPLLHSVIQQRAAFLQAHTQKHLLAHTPRGIFNNGLVQDLKLFITCKVPIKGNRPNQEEGVQLAQLRIKVESSLRTIGLRPQTITAAHYIRIMNTLLNWGENAAWRHEAVQWETDKPIAAQVFDYDTDIEVKKNGIRLGDCHVKVLSAKKITDLFYFGDAITYIGDLSGGNSSLKENYLVVTNLYFPDTEKTKGALERKRQFTVNQAYGPLLKFVPVLADKKESFDILYESMKEGARPVKLSYSVVLFAPTQERVESAAIAARALWRENRFELMEDQFISFPMFINCLPLCTDRHAIRDLFRYKTITTEHAAVVIPLFGEWKGTGTFHAALLSRNGQLMSLSLHDSDTNKNAVIAAESGSGKSFLTNDKIVSYLSEGALVWVIDAGRSYENLCLLLGGDFIHFGEGSDICLNPFELIQDYEDEEDAVVSLVITMASEDDALDDWQSAKLKQLMRELWNEKGSTMTVDDIAKRCLEGSDQRIQDVGTQLYPFTSQGSYGRYVCGPNTIHFNNPFTVLELDDLQGRKHLRQVILMQLIYRIQREVYLGERDRKKIVFIDEGWDLLNV